MKTRLEKKKLLTTALKKNKCFAIKGSKIKHYINHNNLKTAKQLTIAFRKKEVICSLRKNNPTKSRMWKQNNIMG